MCICGNGVVDLRIYVPFGREGCFFRGSFWRAYLHVIVSSKFYVYANTINNNSFPIGSSSSSSMHTFV